MADIPHEGEVNFALEETEDNTSAESPTENNEQDDTQATEGEDENTQSDNQDDDPDNTDKNDVLKDGQRLDQHPRWRKREKEWKERFNEQETRYQDEIQKLRKELLGNKKDDVNFNEDDYEINSGWFGGDKQQWKQYVIYNDKRLQAIQDNTLTKINEAKAAEDKAVKDATDFMQSEVKSIESDKELNPDGKKIDVNKLVKFTIDNDLVDSKGRWNYKAGWRLMDTSANNNTNDRKKIAGATISKSSGEVKPTSFKTSEDFKSNKPW